MYFLTFPWIPSSNHLFQQRLTAYIQQYAVFLQTVFHRKSEQIVSWMPRNRSKTMMIHVTNCFLLPGNDFMSISWLQFLTDSISNDVLTLFFVCNQPKCFPQTLCTLIVKITWYRRTRVIISRIAFAFIYSWFVIKSITVVKYIVVSVTLWPTFTPGHSFWLFFSLTRKRDKTSMEAKEVNCSRE